MSRTDDDPLITSGEVAEMAGVTITTVNRWIDTGLLEPASYTLGGHARFRLREVQAVLAASGPRGQAS